MSTETILCAGNDLAAHLSDICSRGGRGEVMDTGVEGNAGYRLHVNFGRVAELAQPVAVRRDADGTYCQQVNNPAAPNPFPAQPRTSPLREGGAKAEAALLRPTNFAPGAWDEKFDRRIASRLFRNAQHIDLSQVPDFSTT